MSHDRVTFKDSKNIHRTIVMLIGGEHVGESRPFIWAQTKAGNIEVVKLSVRKIRAIRNWGDRELAKAAKRKGGK